MSIAAIDPPSTNEIPSGRGEKGREKFVDAAGPGWAWDWGISTVGPKDDPNSSKSSNEPASSADSASSGQDDAGPQATPQLESSAEGSPPEDAPGTESTTGEELVPTPAMSGGGASRPGQDPFGPPSGTGAFDAAREFIGDTIYIIEFYQKYGDVFGADPAFSRRSGFAEPAFDNRLKPVNDRRTIEFFEGDTGKRGAVVFRPGSTKPWHEKDVEEVYVFDESEDPSGETSVTPPGGFGPITPEENPPESGLLPGESWTDPLTFETYTNTSLDGRIWYPFRNDDHTIGMTVSPPFTVPPDPSYPGQVEEGE